MLTRSYPSRIRLARQMTRIVASPARPAATRRTGDPVGGAEAGTVVVVVGWVAGTRPDSVEVLSAAALAGTRAPKNWRLVASPIALKP